MFFKFCFVSWFLYFFALFCFWFWFCVWLGWTFTQRNKHHQGYIKYSGPLSRLLETFENGKNVFAQVNYDLHEHNLWRNVKDFNQFWSSILSSQMYTVHDLAQGLGLHCVLVVKGWALIIPGLQATSRYNHTHLFLSLYIEAKDLTLGIFLVLCEIVNLLIIYVQFWYFTKMTSIEGLFFFSWQNFLWHMCTHAFL